MTQTDHFKIIDSAFRDIDFQQLIRIAGMHQIVVQRYSEEDGKRLLMMGARIGLQSNGTLNDTQREFIREVFRYTYSGDPEKLYSFMEQETDEEEYLLLGYVLKDPYSVVLSLINFILCFAYADGIVEERLKNQLDSLFHLNELISFKSDDSWNPYPPEALLQEDAIYILEYLDNRDQQYNAKLFKAIHLNTGKAIIPIKHLFDELENKGILRIVKTDSGKMIRFTGFPYKRSAGWGRYPHIPVSPDLTISIPAAMNYINAPLVAGNGLHILTAYSWELDDTKLDNLRDPSAADSYLIVSAGKLLPFRYSGYSGLLRAIPALAEYTDHLQGVKSSTRITDAVIIRYYRTDETTAEWLVIAGNMLFHIRYCIKDAESAEKQEEAFQDFTEKIVLVNSKIRKKEMPVQNPGLTDDMNELKEYIAELIAARQRREAFLNASVQRNEERIRNATGDWQTLLPETKAELQEMTERTAEILQERRQRVLHRGFPNDLFPRKNGPLIRLGKQGGLWRILDADPETNTLLVLSERSVWTMRNPVFTKNITWEISVVRQWLNEDFFETEFTEEEKQAIRTTHLSNLDHRESARNSGTDTDDRVFLLSEEEAYMYFRNDSDRRMEIHAGEWLLRSPGRMDNYWMTVGYQGRIWCPWFSGTHVNESRRFSESAVDIRPVLRFDPGFPIPRPAVIKVEDGHVLPDEQDLLKPGNVILFGKNRICWRILNIDPDTGAVLVMADQPVAFRPFHDTKKEDPGWETCSLRKWLNEVYFKEAFSESEQEAILSTHLVNKSSEYRRDKTARKWNDTFDRIFLLSQEEVRQYLRTDEERANGYTYWLRSPGRYHGYRKTVDRDGSLSYNDRLLNEDLYVCPAFRLDRNAPAFRSLVILE